MKLGILGTGMIVADLMQTYDSLPIEKTVLLGTERSREKAEQLAQNHGFAQVFYDYDELLASDIDTVYVALPNHLHYAFAKKALEAGKHAIIEKPICSNPQELESLMALSEERHLMVIEAMTIPYTPTFQKIQEHLQDLGKLRIVSLNYSQYSHRYDAFKAGTILPAFDMHKSGGALMDLNVYNVSLLVNLFGAPEQVRYQANIERGIDTSGVVTLDYGSFQAVAIAAKDCKAPVMNTFQGDEGVLEIAKPVNQMTEFTIERNDGTKEEIAAGVGIHRMSYEFREFIRMVDEGDYAEMQRRLTASHTVSKIMYGARQDAGIVFDADAAWN